MRKKILTLVLLGAMTVSMITGCDGKKDKNEDTTTEAPTASEQIKDDITEEPTSEPTTEPTSEPNQSSTITLDEIIEANSLDGQTISNSVIGFSFTYPENWIAYDSDDTYRFVALNSGISEDQIETIKTQTSAAGTLYMSYAMDTNTSQFGGTSNIIIQSMSGSIINVMDDETILSSISQSVVQQFKQIGATCTIEPTQTVEIDGQKVYIIPSYTTVAQQGAEAIGVTQEYFAFRRNDVFVYMAVTITDKDSSILHQATIDGLSFQ